MDKKFLLSAALVSVFVLSACAGNATETANESEPIPVVVLNDSATQTPVPIPTAVPTESSIPVVNEDARPTIPVVVEAATTDPNAYSAQPFANVVLTNARTGTTFRLADLAGKTVYVHPMATWCPKCRSSQQNLRNNIVPQVNSDEVVFVSISLEGSTIDDADLALYADNNGFPWTFAIASTEMLQTLVSQFGQSVTNAPSQPHFIIGPTGATTGLLLGDEPASAILDRIQNAQGA